MKKLLLAGLLSIAAFTKAQTITYANFSQSLNDTLYVNLANNSTFNTAAPTITGMNVTWDVSWMTVQYAPINLSFNDPTATPNGNLYSASNYCEFDPALTSMLEYNYYGINSDSMIHYGSYAPDGSHEIFQDPDKRLVFPFAYGQSFTDNYAKTNYSDATTISSYQTGTRTVTYAGYGDLILPQGIVHDIAFIKDVRTNSLGPDSYYYTWYQVSTGVKWLLRTENNGSITTAWNGNPVPTAGLKNNDLNTQGVVYPNPLTEGTTLKFTGELKNGAATLNIYSMLGELVLKTAQNTNEFNIDRTILKGGIYYYEIKSDTETISRGKLIVK